MQQITIHGFLSRDAEQATTRDGSTVTRWNVPVRQGFGDSEKTNWYRVSVWGKRADYAARARKGDLVFVTGDFTIGEYDGKPQYEVRAGDFHLSSKAPSEPRAAPVDAARQHFPDAEALDDEIPF